MATKREVEEVIREELSGLWAELGRPEIVMCTDCRHVCVRGDDRLNVGTRVPRDILRDQIFKEMMKRLAQINAECGCTCELCRQGNVHSE